MCKLMIKNLVKSLIKIWPKICYKEAGIALAKRFFLFSLSLSLFLYLLVPD
jgi:hypothetical protein